MCQPSAMMDDFGKPARAESCWIELGRTFRSSDPCRLVVLGEVNHVAGDAGLQNFPGIADVIHWNEGKGLGPLERSSDARTLYSRTISKREKFLHHITSSICSITRSLRTCMNSNKE